MEENIVAIRDPKTCFNFDSLKDADENLKHDTELIKSN